MAFYSLIIGIVSAIFTDRVTKQSLISQKLADLDIVCATLKIDLPTKLSMRTCIENSANQITYHWLDPNLQLFNDLPMRLKYDFLQSLYKNLITQCPFFSSYDISFVIRMVPLLKPHFLKTGDVIWSEGDYARYSNRRFTSLLPH